jgi:hypothetical protein
VPPSDKQFLPPSALPALEDLLESGSRQVSLLTQNDGNEDFVFRNNITDPVEQLKWRFGADIQPGGEMKIRPGGEDELSLSYVVYQMTGMDLERPVDLDVTVATVAGKRCEYFIALFDFSSGKWESRGPFTASTVLVLNSAEVRNLYVSTNHSMFYAVVAFNQLQQQDVEFDVLSTEAATLNAVDPVASGYFPTRPRLPVFTAKGPSMLKRPSDLAELQMIVDWTHAEDSANDALEANFYRVERLEAGQSAKVGIYADLYRDDEPLETTVCVDQYAEGNVNTATPGREYFVYLTAINTTTELQSAVSRVGPFIFPIIPPELLSATDGTLDDAIQCSWSKAPGALQYRVRRSPNFPSGQDKLIAASGEATQTWLDTQVEAGETYTYEVATVGAKAESAFSAPDPGQAN